MRLFRAAPQTVETDLTFPVGTVPESHAAGLVPAAVDQSHDDDTQLRNYAPRESRSWRAVQLAGAPLTAGTDEQAGAQIGPHVGAGQPDPRHVWGGTAGHTGPTRPELNPKPETVRNIRELELVNNQTPIDRPRAGSTSADPTRPSWMPKWLFAAPFDQWAQYGPAAHPKIEQGSPLASLPLTYTDALAGAYPSAAGSGATTKEGVDVQPNTTRLLPQPSDAGLVARNTDTTVAYDAHARSRGWGLR